ncbi:glucokinase [Breznakia blatticola]|uniref:Glucokinase n=1 Tax=Breznakia blatticola TaxID=1754012 RepID=A0A4R7ZFU9_9FIRM|nr:ROK family glucokinase [Breznakia blatticola]TDW16182.1 glucokinase [Breznakia blatticola]
MNEKDIVIGIDLGGTTTKFGMYTSEGTCLETWTIPTDTNEAGKQIVPNMCKSILSTLVDKNYTSKQLLGIGIGAPGVVSQEEGTVKNAFNLGWAKTQDIRKTFQQYDLDVPLYLTNDANCAAYGEASVSHASNIVFITLGTGVGGGVVINNSILTGTANSAGEIGHLHSSLNYGFTCTCGNENCLETVASATGIVNVAYVESKTFMEDSKLQKAIENDEEITAKLVFDLVKENDKLACKGVDVITYDLGVACANIANIVNPESVIIGGGVSQAGNILLHKIVSVFEKVAFPLVRQSTDIKLATLGNDAGITGAAQMVIQGEAKYDENF